MLNAITSFALTTHHLLPGTHGHCSGWKASRRASFTYYVARHTERHHFAIIIQVTIKIACASPPPLSEACLSGASVYCRRNLSIHSLSSTPSQPSARRLRISPKRIDQTPFNCPCPSNHRFEASPSIRLRLLERCNARRVQPSIAKLRISEGRTSQRQSRDCRKS
jgi:hypothetical protein